MLDTDNGALSVAAVSQTLQFQIKACGYTSIETKYCISSETLTIQVESFEFQSESFGDEIVTPVNESVNIETFLDKYEKECKDISS